MRVHMYVRNVPEEATDDAHPVLPSITVVEDAIDRARGDPRGAD